MAMLEMLSGARGYLVVEDRMRDVLGASLKSPNPDPQLIREFASSRVSLSPEGLRQYDPDALAAATAAAPTAPAGVPAADAATAPARAAAASRAAPAPSTARPARGVSSPDAPTTPRSGSASPSAPSAATRRLSRPITVAPTGESCPHCKGDLPAGRQINFCPHCGQDLTIEHCPACGSELEHGWKFCVTCGRAAAGG